MSQPEKICSAFDAKTHLSRLLQIVEHGQTVLITRRGKPVARLVPVKESSSGTDFSDLARQFRNFRDKVQGEVNISEWKREGRKR